MSGWDDVDQWASERLARTRGVKVDGAEAAKRGVEAHMTKKEKRNAAARLKTVEQGMRCGFAIVRFADGTSLRFAARENSPHIEVERPCHFVPGKWRIVKKIHVSRWVDTGAEGIRGLTHRVVCWVLVERDRWLEEGAKPRRTIPALDEPAPAGRP